MLAVLKTTGVLQAFASIRMAPARGGRAVHKPLLLLFALARVMRGELRVMSYSDSERAFKQLLAELGSTNSQVTRNLPFWHLCNDAAGVVWQLEIPSGVVVKVMSH